MAQNPGMISQTQILHHLAGCHLNLKLTSMLSITSSLLFPLFKPPPRPKFHFIVSMPRAKFLTWDKGELRTIQFSKSKKPGRKDTRRIRYHTCEVPAPYDRIVCQLVLEDTHAEKHNSHESVRRQTYARRVLDAFAEEVLDNRIPSADFRSTILTPILQRQLAGVPDAYMPSVRSAVGRGKPKPTILDVTKVYLSRDLTDPSFIQTFRRNMVYIPEMRWHLAITQDPALVGNAGYFNQIRDDQDQIMERLRMGFDGHNKMGVPWLTREEVTVIFTEGLEDFFAPELSDVVSSHPQHILLLAQLPLSPPLQAEMAKDVRAQLDKARKKRRLAGATPGKSHIDPVTIAPEKAPTPVEDSEHTVDNPGPSSPESQVSSPPISNNLMDPANTPISQQMYRLKRPV